MRAPILQTIKSKAINNSNFLITQMLTKNQSAEQQKQKFYSYNIGLVLMQTHVKIHFFGLSIW